MIPHCESLILITHRALSNRLVEAVTVCRHCLTNKQNRAPPKTRIPLRISENSPRYQKNCQMQIGAHVQART